MARLTRLPPGRWSDAVRAGLEAMIGAHGAGAAGYDPNRPPVAAFDWDNTCITGDIGEACLRRIDAEARPGVWREYERLCREQGDAIGYRFCAEVVGGRHEHALRAWTGAVIADCLRSGEIVERPEIRDLIWTLQRAGWEVWIVSASASPLVEVFAQRYGVPANRVVGMDLRRDEDGTLHEEVVGPVTYRGGKVEAIDLRVGRRPTFAVGDAPTDLEMLASAAYALVFDRGHPLLARAAREAGWWVQAPFQA
jgi:HAD superfamily phosphoserine phosphatase-like hydrolase